ncbi:hypothetical protein [Bacillus thuringiensis]|uniref:hypothetical protein n=1 Tax=Bacillus thuringiensis TaxID=1428 RepID=UPI0026E44EF2|nr:hypothetical protein [Bacillus thuringiensis]MDO6631775.1 hypothetical protein [Bacillus thuringiensis]MDO6661394.1 hypothetical protein [Bacillus thuringiensis]MDO6701915.1 hypothetical protein [Bacillus thuringiensis]
MGCNGQLLTEEQVDMLQFMIHNHYKKNMDICSCDVERVLGRTEIGLTKLELAIVIAAFVKSLGVEELAQCVDEHTLKRLNEEAEKVNYNSSPKEVHEAVISAIKKMIQGLLKEKQSPHLQKNTKIPKGTDGGGLFQ